MVEVATIWGSRTRQEAGLEEAKTAAATEAGPGICVRSRADTSAELKARSQPPWRGVADALAWRGAGGALPWELGVPAALGQAIARSCAGDLRRALVAAQLLAPQGP